MYYSRMIIYILICIAIVCVVLAVANAWNTEAFESTSNYMPPILRDPTALQCNKDLNYGPDANTTPPCIYEWDAPYFVGDSTLTLPSTADTWIGENNLQSLLGDLEGHTQSCARSGEKVKKRVRAELDSIQLQTLVVDRHIRTDAQTLKSAKRIQSQFTKLKNMVGHLERVKCYPSDRKCQTGYSLRVPNPHYWGCGEKCAGGAYWTDTSCNCACVRNIECEPN